jgi:hypothetical protein
MSSMSAIFQYIALRAAVWNVRYEPIVCEFSSTNKLDWLIISTTQFYRGHGRAQLRYPHPTMVELKAALYSDYEEHVTAGAFAPDSEAGRPSYL